MDYTLFHAVQNWFKIYKDIDWQNNVDGYARFRNRKNKHTDPVRYLTDPVRYLTDPENMQNKLKDFAEFQGVDWRKLQNLANRIEASKSIPTPGRIPELAINLGPGQEKALRVMALMDRQTLRVEKATAEMSCSVVILKTNNFNELSSESLRDLIGEKSQVKAYFDGTYEMGVTAYRYLRDIILKKAVYDTKRNQWQL